MLPDPAGPHSTRLSRASMSYVTVTLAGAGACLAGLAFPGMVRQDRVGLMLTAIGVMVAVGVVTVLWTAAWRWVAHLQGGVLLGGGCVIMSCLADPIEFSLAAGWFSLIPILFATSLSRRWVTGYLVVAVGLSLFSIATIPGSPGAIGVRLLLMAGLVAFPVTIFMLQRRELDAALCLATRLATTDPLTRLLNRRGLAEALPVLAAEANHDGALVALLLCDLDHFKRVNDSLGHAAGDDVLRCVASTLQEHTRREDVVARLGGEEFAVLTSSRSAADAVTLAERLREQVETDCRDWDVTVSIGVAVTAPIAQGPVHLLDLLLTPADRAMYSVKAAGRNGVQLASAPVPAQRLPAPTRARAGG